MAKNSLGEVDKEVILKKITNHYLSSGDFNGISAIGLTQGLKANWRDLIGYLTELITEEKICVLYTSTDVNPHIMRRGHEPKEKQISGLNVKNDLFHTCLYPMPKHLEQVVDRTQYEGKPYILKLVLGSPQLTHRAFDLSILEFYRNDPRYYYSNDDIWGDIHIKSEYYDTGEVDEKDQILLESFGFCYDDNLNRAVAVFLRYLAKLSPEHQQIWKAKQLKGDYKLHPDYYRTAIIGDWGTKVSIFDAFTDELRIINRMAEAMQRPALFRKDFSQSNKPAEFAFLVRPTLKEYNDFVLLLDKMISDNINKKFFQNDVSYKYEEVRSDGKIFEREKGTLTILDEWIHKKYRAADWELIDNMMAVFRQIRRERQKPAHSVEENVFDQQYFHRQRELIIQAYDSINILRQLFSHHPKAANVKVPSYLQNGEIWTR